MNCIGFPRPKMEEERRIALLPPEISKLAHPRALFFEAGYGEDCGYDDSDYLKIGANIISDQNVYTLEVICQPKYCAGDLPHLRRGQTIFGWVHFGLDSEVDKALKAKEATIIEWSEMRKRGKPIFQRNGELTGEVGVTQAISYAGKIPEECRVAVIGRGRVGTGAVRQLQKLGVKEENITVYHSENYSALKRNIGCYDTVVHCAYSVQPSILTRQEISAMKKGALLVHLGGDNIKGRFDTNSIYSPVSFFNSGRNLVYCVNHVPTLVYQTASRYISEDVAPYIDKLIEGNFDSVLKRAMVMEKGKVIR